MKSLLINMKKPTSNTYKRMKKKKDSLLFTHWGFWPDTFITEVENKQATKMTT